jgi:hypothetical protein
MPIIEYLHVTQINSFSGSDLVLPELALRAMMLFSCLSQVHYMSSRFLTIPP